MTDTAKAKHTLKVGDVVTFKYFDGDHYTGVISKLCYMGEKIQNPNYNLPVYNIDVKTDSKTRPITVYTSVSDTSITEINGKSIPELHKQLKFSKDDKVYGSSIKNAIPVPELEDEIQKQKDFLNGIVNQ
jgi:hypothetical protein